MNMQAQGTGIDLTLPDHITSLATSAFTMTIDVSCWTAQKSDRDLANKISADGHASQNVGKWAHDLFARDPELKAVHNHRQAVHNWQVSPGVSYEHQGRERLFPQHTAPEAIARVKALKSAFETKVALFLDGDAAAGIPDYDAKIAAQAFVRGDHFRRSDYPTKEQVRAKFRFHWSIGKVQEDDFRNMVAHDLANDLAVHMNRQHLRVLDEIAEAQRSQLVGLLQSLSHCCAMEEADDGAIRFRRLHAATVEKTLALCDTFAQFNPIGDVLLADACLTLRGVLSRYGSDEGLAQLKGSEMLREAVKATADDLLSKFTF